MISKKEIMPVGADEYAYKFRNFDFHERRVPQKQTSRDRMTFHRVIIKETASHT